MGTLHELFDQQGQSPWLDNLRRSWINSGELERWIERGVRGLTSNPSIFQKAIADSDDYTPQLAQLVRAGVSMEDAYWSLVIRDIQDALRVLAPLYERSRGIDGYVSIEVDPRLARDTAATEHQARSLWNRIAEPNLYVKIPATVEGLPAIRTMIGEGCNTNVTLIFDLDRYDQVIEAYMLGLEDALGSGVEDLSRISSVASFFISRVDTEVERRLDLIGDERATAVRGTAAIAQARLAYDLFVRRFAGARWKRLAAAGARAQRPLWASTSTKNPSYPDTLYVDSLIGPASVNTLPDATLLAFEDHGTVARTVDLDVEGARRRWKELGELVDMADVAATLEHEGIGAFERAFVELLEVLDSRAGEL